MMSGEAAERQYQMEYQLPEAAVAYDGLSDARRRSIEAAFSSLNVIEMNAHTQC
jgi:hypothetical protein